MEARRRAITEEAKLRNVMSEPSAEPLTENNKHAINGCGHHFPETKITKATTKALNEDATKDGMKGRKHTPKHALKKYLNLY